MFIRTLSLAAGLFGAVVAAQLPELVQQYNQRLGGAIDEVAAIVSRFDYDAASNSLKRVSKSRGTAELNAATAPKSSR